MRKQSNFYKKFLATTVAASAAVVASNSVIPANVEAAGVTFTDVADGWFFTEPVKALAAQNVLNGYADGTFLPFNNVTRAEVAKIITAAIGLDTQNVTNPNFTDVAEGSWYYPYVAALAKANIVGGYGDRSFKPNATITRAEMAKIIVEAYDLVDKNQNVKNTFTDVDNNAWYANYVEALVENDIANGRTPTTFVPEGMLTRGEAATLVYRSENLSQVIKNVTDSAVTINGVEYTFSNELKGLFNEDNKEILTNAIISFEANNKTINKVTYLEITSSGEAAKTGEEEFSSNLVLDGGNAVIDGSLKISADYISINNLVISDDLEIGTELQHDFYSDNIEVKGKTIVNGGDTNTVVFKNGKLKQVEVNKPNVRVEPQGNTSISEIVVTSNATISADASVTIQKLTVSENVSSLELNANVESLVLESNQTLNLTGAATITNLVVTGDAPVKLNITGSITNLVIPEGTKAEDIISNYDQVKDQIDNVTDEIPTEPGTPPGGGGGGGGNPTPVQERPLIQNLSFVGNIGRNTTSIDFDWRNIPLNPQITVSEDSELVLRVEGVGSIGTLNLLEGANTIDALALSKLGLNVIDFSGINFTNLYNSINRDVILGAVDLSNILTIMSDYSDPTIKSKLYESINYEAIFSAFNTVDDDDKLKVYEALNVETIISILSNDPGVEEEDFIKLTAPIYLQLQGKVENLPAPADLLSSPDKQQIISDIFDEIEANPNLKLEIFNAINFTDVFETLNKLNTNSKLAVLDAINMNAILEVAEGIDDSTWNTILGAIDVEDIFTALDSIDPATKAAIVSEINFETILSELKGVNGAGYTLVNMLASLDRDGNNSVLTIRADLTDEDDNLTTTYQLRTSANNPE